MDIKSWIVSTLPPTAIIVEAGSADGSDTVWFADHIPNGAIYGFEPNPDLFKLALAKTHGYHNVEIINKALALHDGQSAIHISDRFGEPFGSSSLLKPKEHINIHPEITFNRIIDVETIKLDEWSESKNLRSIDLLWLDMQGYEPVVLSGSPKTLSRTKYLYTEVSLIETYDKVMLYPEYKKFLANQGFKVVFEDLPWEDMGNVLFENTVK